VRTQLEIGVDPSAALVLAAGPQDTLLRCCCLPAQTSIVAPIDPMVRRLATPAVRSGRTGVVAALLASACKPNLARKDSAEHAPLDWAIELQLKLTAVMLIEASAPLTAPTGLCTNAVQAPVVRGVNVRELHGEFSRPPLCVWLQSRSTRGRLRAPVTC
jgi:hypothetical protein